MSTTRPPGANLPHRSSWRNPALPQRQELPQYGSFCGQQMAASGPPRQGRHAKLQRRGGVRAAERSRPADDAEEEEPVEAGVDIEGDERNELAIEALQLGTWRLRGRLDAPYEGLAAQTEGMWRGMLPDLMLYPLPKEFKYCDSLDPKQEYGPWAYEELEDPPKDSEAYPRLQIENRCYENRVFRKLHLELSVRQDGLQVMHCVMYPKGNFDFPILSMDLVGKDDRVSLGIIDPCPVAMDRSLPPLYAQAVRRLQQQYRMVNNRSIPDWGAAIFSDACVIIRPTSDEELADFLKYCIALVRVHLHMSLNAMPVQTNREKRLKDIEAANKRYCEKQRENDKTRRILVNGFDEEFADQFMNLVLFDFEPFREPAPAAAADVK
ncbi:hypothetical protein WJX72_005832 [[Myrmecia] bisecta]|uniref:Phycocyanobilin:ferredoxin oxidoreductase n=1 Tax=[Myrmecia] bisecta TaxID=41462 RepID=A0AAW1Q122_9CHLO